MKSNLSRNIVFSLLLAAGSLPVIQVQASPRDQAKRLYERISKTPPSAAVLDQLEPLVKSQDWAQATAIAQSSPAFYNLGLKNWITSWTNVAKVSNQPLNDYTATVIGMIRDEIPFDQVLYGDLLYVGSPQLVTAGTLKAFAMNSNEHYENIESKGIDLSVPTNLVKVVQSTQTGIADTAGVLTTRAAGAAFFSAGTNRRMFRFTSINFLCRDLESLQDTTVPDTRVRRDVERSPGGDSRVYKNRCVGCHGLQDGLGGAFAYFDFTNGQVQYTPGRVQNKYNQNDKVFPAGFVTTDDSWMNLISEGRNSALGWRKPAGGEIEQGNGARALGRTLAATKAFSSCMVERVFNYVCLRSPTVSERSALDPIAEKLEAQNYNLKKIFAEVVPFCIGN